MLTALIELGTWTVVLPLLLGLAVASKQARAASDRRRQTGDGWNAHDTFEVKNAIFGAAAFCFPMALTFSYWSAGIELPAWQWWGVLIAIVLVGSLPMQVHSLWLASQRKLIGIDDLAASRHEPGPN